MTTPKFLTDAPRYMFFTGKGGVGKTSIACASALVFRLGSKDIRTPQTRENREVEPHRARPIPG